MDTIMQSEHLGGILVIIGLLIIMYYADLIGSVLKRHTTKHRFYLGLIPFVFWIIIFLEQFNELEQ